MSKEQSNKFHYLSFAMTCLIVAYHANGGYPSLYDGKIDKCIFEIVRNILIAGCSIAMGYFFFTTGYFMYGGLTVDNVKGRISRRVHSLLIPFLIWNAIYFVFYLVKGYDVRNLMSIQEILDKLVYQPFAGSLWYIVVVFVLALFSPLFLKLIKYKKLFLFLYVLLCIYSFCATLTGIQICSGYCANTLSYLPNYFWDNVWILLSGLRCKKMEAVGTYICYIADSKNYV